ncbi:hypothetical protein [Streptomyces erythrochromogenes]
MKAETAPFETPARQSGAQPSAPVIQDTVTRFHQDGPGATQR